MSIYCSSKNAAPIITTDLRAVSAAAFCYSTSLKHCEENFNKKTKQTHFHEKELEPFLSAQFSAAGQTSTTEIHLMPAMMSSMHAHNGSHKSRLGHPAVLRSIPHGALSNCRPGCLTRQAIAHTCIFKSRPGLHLLTR